MNRATHRRGPIVVLTVVALLGLAVQSAAADYQKGLDNFKAGKYVEAAAEFQALVDQSPEYDYGYYILGLSFLKLDKIPDAENNLRKAVELNPDRFEYHQGLAKVLLQRRQYREVIKTLGPAEGLATDSNTKYMVYSMRGFAWASQRKWPEAIEELEKARALKATPSVLGQLGKAYYSMGHSDKAVPIFRQTLKSRPEDAETWMLLAESLIKLGKEAPDAATKSRHYRSAVEAADTYRKLEPNSFEPVNLVGKAALGAGDYPKATQAFRQVLKMKPDYCYAMINLGKTYIAQEQWDLADGPFQDALNCSPQEPVIYESLGLVYQKYGKERQERKLYDEAKVNYDRALGYYNKAREIKSSGFVAKAIASIRENLQVIDHNRGMDQLDLEQQRKEAELLAEQQEEERKRAEWEARRKRDN